MFNIVDLALIVIIFIAGFVGYHAGYTFGINDTFDLFSSFFNVTLRENKHDD